MSDYAVKEAPDGALRLIERLPSGKWRAIAADLDDDELADEVFELCSDGLLDPGQIVPVLRADGTRADRRAVALCRPPQRRELGWALDDMPVAGRARDRYDR